MEIVRPFDRAVVAHNPHRFAAAAPSYDFTETFETNPGYDNTPDATAGTPEPDYSDSAIDGSESLRLESNEYVRWNDPLSGASDYYIYLKFRIDTWAEYKDMFYVLGSGSENCGGVQTYATSQSYNLTFDHGCAGTGGSGFNSGTWHAWLDFVSGTSLKLYTSSTATKPGSPTISDTSSVPSVTPYYFTFIAVSGIVIVYDSIIISSSVIGSDPL